MFHFIASTGRTATTFMAAFLDQLEGVSACHEGYSGGDESEQPLLPLINLENALCYRKPESAGDVVKTKRNSRNITEALDRSGGKVLVDVAYYNPMLADALLEYHKDSRMVAVIRDCASFVRSATCLYGEDPLPVGWPSPEKTLTEREKFIGMGRIRPLRASPDYDAWHGWSAICRNIWLWKETNRILLAAVETYPERALVLDFRSLKSDPEGFLRSVICHLGIPAPSDMGGTIKACSTYRNEKPAGYQVGEPAEWLPEERSMLAHAQEQIDEMTENVTANRNDLQGH